MKKIISFLLLSSFMLLTLLPLHYGSAVADPAGTPVTLVNPIDEDNPNVVIGKIIAAILGIVGSLALLMFVYGGLTWMTAAGNKDRVTKGKDVLVWATLGLVVIFSSYALINFILSGLGVNNDTSPDP